MSNIVFKPAEKAMGQQCESVLRTVPEWFGCEESLLEYVAEIDTLATYTAWDEGKLIGFFSVNEHNPYSAELHVLAVDKAYHRHGIGKALYEMIKKDLKVKSVKFLQVKTLGTSVGDDNYAKTYQFYLSLGFLPLEESFEIWGEDTPCSIMIKSL